MNLPWLLLALMTTRCWLSGMRPNLCSAALPATFPPHGLYERVWLPIMLSPRRCFAILSKKPLARSCSLTGSHYLRPGWVYSGRASGGSRRHFICWRSPGLSDWRALSRRYWRRHWNWHALRQYDRGYRWRCDRTAVISLGGVVVHKSARVAGTKIDEAIVNYIRRKYKSVYRWSNRRKKSSLKLVPLCPWTKKSTWR